MTSQEDAQVLAEMAGMLADRTRAGFCLALLDGRAWTAGELARHGGVAASTASDHLDRLVAGGLLAEQRQGRHRYVRIANHEVAGLLEELAGRLGPPHPARTLRAQTKAAALRRARTCYDHLAGRLGVAITDAMVSAGYLLDRDGMALTDRGAGWLSESLGADVAAMRDARRPMVRGCLDWTERRRHLAGSAGANLLHRFRQRGWIDGVGDGRAVALTGDGAAAVRDLFGIDPAPYLHPRIGASVECGDTGRTDSPQAARWPWLSPSCRCMSPIPNARTGSRVRRPNASPTSRDTSRASRMDEWS